MLIMISYVLVMLNSMLSMLSIMFIMLSIMLIMLSDVLILLSIMLSMLSLLLIIILKLSFLGSCSLALPFGAPGPPQGASKTLPEPVVESFWDLPASIWRGISTSQVKNNNKIVWQGGPNGTGKVPLHFLFDVCFICFLLYMHVRFFVVTCMFVCLCCLLFFGV